LESDVIVIRPKEGYVATNVSATYNTSGFIAPPPAEIPDYDYWFD